MKLPMDVRGVVLQCVSEQPDRGELSVDIPRFPLLSTTSLPERCLAHQQGRTVNRYQVLRFILKNG